jgi:nicotinamide riboside kinase
VRVAFSGSHRTGKTTLVEALSRVLAGYEVIDEPYRLLEEAGQELSDPPSVEDYEQQLRTSIQLVADAPQDALLDRCPLDFVAYLQAVDEDFEPDDWQHDVRRAMVRLDLVVVVPIETPERIAVPAHEDLRLRRRVDQHVQELALEDAWGLALETIEVSGTLEERLRQVIRAVTVERATGEHAP